MSAPLSRVYPERVDLARRSPLLQVVPAVIVLGLLGIAGVGFAWSSAVRSRHTQTENYNLLLSVVAGRLQLTPEEEAAAQRTAERVRGMDAQQIAKLDVELRRELSAKASATELDTKVSSSDLEHVSAKSRRAQGTRQREKRYASHHR
jgi:hypothetical protein